VNASISSINAYKQAVVSAQSSLDAMEAGYSVVRVLSLTSRRDHHAVQRETAALQRALQYLINQLNIKQALGTLNEQDLQMLNSTLGKPVSPDSVAPENPSRLPRLITSTLTAHPCGTAGCAQPQPPARQ
jgi:outer membrane protein